MGCGNSTSKKDVYDHTINLDLNDVNGAGIETSEHLSADDAALADAHGGEIVLSSSEVHSAIETYPVTINGSETRRRAQQQQQQQHEHEHEQQLETSWSAVSGGSGGGSGGGTGGGTGKDKKSGKVRKAVFARGFNSKDKGAPTRTKTAKTDEQAAVLVEALSKCYLFSDLAEVDRNELVAYMWREKVKAGSSVVTQGKKSDCFYLIEAGTFEVSVNGTVTSVRSGACPEPFFAESALLFVSRAEATIKCVSGDNQDDEGATAAGAGSSKYAYVWALDRTTYRHIITSQLISNRDEFRAAVEAIPMLAEFLTPGQLDKVVDAMEMVRVKADQRIIRKGDHGSVLYFIKSGTVNCSNIGSEGLGQIELGPGSYFGERALLTDEPRAADVTTTKDSVLLCLSKKSFTELLGPLRALMDETMKSRVVEAVPILQQLPKGLRRKVINQFEVVFFKDQEPIFYEGDVGDRFFVVRSGMVDVLSVELGAGSGSNGHHSEASVTASETSSQASSSPVPSGSARRSAEETREGFGAKIATLHEGEWFGEMALLNNEPRSATCVAVGEVECFALSFDAFKVLSRKSDLLLNTSARRAEENRSKRFSTALHDYSRLSLKDLSKSKILGKGTFGTVYLVESTNKAPVQGVWALKVMNKAHIVDCDQTRNVVNEKLVLQELRHPFILQLFATFQDRDSLYMLLDFVQGGELFSIMQQHYRLPLPHAQFYSACIVDALDYMHSLNFVYRDLKPENVLIDAQGFVKIADFGFAKRISGKTFTLCGTPEYLAPEIILSKGHDKGVDFWAVGILIYEMLAGISPFADQYSDDSIEVCRAIVAGKVDYDQLEAAIRETELTPPSTLSEREVNYVFNQAKATERSGRSKGSSSALATRRPSLNSRPVEHLIRKLLVKNAHQRLGCLKDGAQDIKRHPFFGIPSSGWEDLRARSWIPPYQPVLRSKTDASLFDDFEPDATWATYSGSEDWCRDF